MMTKGSHTYGQPLTDYCSCQDAIYSFMSGRVYCVPTFMEISNASGLLIYLQINVAMLISVCNIGDH